MGLEQKCKVDLNGRQSEGSAHCGDGDLSFKGDFRFSWKWRDLTGLKVKDGVLTATCKGKTASFFLRDKAEKWLDAIKNPKERLEKLGVKPGHKFAAVGKFDDTFLDELAAKGAKSGRTELDIAFVRLDSAIGLEKLLKARKQIVQNGMVWAVWPKGGKAFREDDVRAFALKNGLIDVKVASFSDTLSALKLVIPVKDRK